MAEYIVQIDHPELCVEYGGTNYADRLERIVRCKDCGDDTTQDGVKLNHRRYCILQDRIVEPDGFCAWGERRQDA